MIINNHYNQDELKMDKHSKKDYIKAGTWLTIGAITILIWAGVFNLVWPWLAS